MFATPFTAFGRSLLLRVALIACSTMTLSIAQETDPPTAEEAALPETVTSSAPPRDRPTVRPLEVTSSVIAPLDPEVTFSNAPTELAIEDSTSFNRFTAEDLEILRIRRAEDIVRYAPNQFATDSGSRSFGDVYSVRGLTNTVFFGAPATVIYVDDVPFGETFTYAQDLNFIESIEVLRGPQPTLVGRNAYGGLINIQTRRPTNEVEGGLEVGYGSYNAQEYDGYISGPIIDDKLAFRFGAQYDSRDGYMTNTTTGLREDDQEHKGFQGGVYLTPGNNWEISLTASYDEYNDGGTRVTPLGRTTGFYTVGSDTPGEQDRNVDSEALRFAYDDGEFQFVSVTSHRGFELDPFTTDLDYSAGLGPNFTTLSQTQELWSQEFRFAGLFDDPAWKWNAGVYGSTSRVNGNGFRSFIAAPASPLPPFFLVQETTVHTIDETSLAAFGGISYDLNEDIAIHAGGRIDWIERTLDRNKNTLTIPIFPAGAPIPGSSANAGDNDWIHFTPTVGADWKLSDTQLLYAKTSYAFKPGGFSAYVDDPAFVAYGEETSWASELGLKSEWSERLVTNVAVFYNDIDDYQVERGLNNGATDYAVFNAAEAETYGVEFAFQYEIAPSLDFLGSFGYTHARLTDYTDPVSGASLDGVTPPFVPEFDAALALEYHLDNGFFARLEHLAVGNTQFDDFNNQQFEQGGYGIFNAVVGLRKDQWTVSVYGSNLGEKEYYTNINPAVFAGAVGAPSEYGVKMGWEF
jgi:iron complex outermembrane receptor protein